MKVSELLLENENDTITLYHGGRGLEYGGHKNVFPNSKGRWENGPGIYLTTSYMRARSYAKGGRKVYQITIKKGNDLGNSTIPYESVKFFVKQYVSASKRRPFMDDIDQVMNRRNIENDVPGEVFVNLLINDDALNSSRTPILNKFLVDNGIDYSIVSNYGGSGETVIALFNRDLITNVTQMKSDDVVDYNVEFPWNKN